MGGSEESDDGDDDGPDEPVRGVEDEAAQYELEEIAEFADRHSNLSNRPALDEITEALREGHYYTKPGHDGVRFDYNGVRVIVNEANPELSTAYYY